MNEANKSEDLWNPYKELRGIVWRHLNRPNEEYSTAEFENILKKHKQNFFSLLQNPPKNAKSREELKTGMVEGINVRGIGHQILSRELYQETVILSDMFDMNEFVALDLLCTAQIQMPYYPSLPRGLVAILLYYDGRKALVSTLLHLVQARKGIQWTVEVKPEVSKFITDYTDQLMDGGLLNRIYELLRVLDLSKEIEKLQQNLALGGPKHRRQVIDLFNDIRNTLAEIVFTWASQSGLPKEPTLGLINFLKEVKIGEEASGSIDDVNLYMELALLSALDLSILHTREDGEEAVQSLPIFADPTFISTVMVEFQQNKSKWATKGLQALSTFGLAVCVSSLRDTSQGLKYQDIISKEDELADAAIEMNVFTFMHDVLLENKTLYKELYLYKRIHNLLADFIFCMYPKVKDLRMKADEIARTTQIYMRESLEAPANLPKYFEYLLLTVGKFYSNNELNTDFALNYWSPLEKNSVEKQPRALPSRTVSLFKFIRLAGDVLPTTLFIPYVMMLSGLACSPEGARHCFNLLKQPGIHVSANLSWDNFFLSFTRYYNSLRQEVPPQADTIYHNRNVYNKGVSPLELEGLHSVLLLIRTVAKYDNFACLALCQHPSWLPLTVLLGLVSCSVPIPLKADLLLTLAVLSNTAENAAQMWDNLETSQILVTIPTTSSYSPRGIQTELEEIETRMEEYPLTRAFLQLIDVLTNHGIPRNLGAGPRPPGFYPYLNFVINSVFLKHRTRSYRNANEKWEIALLCLKLFEKFLDQYELRQTDFPSEHHEEAGVPPGYHLMIQLNNPSELWKTLMVIIHEGRTFFDSYMTFSGQETVKNCILSILNIIYKVLTLQNKFINLLTSNNTLMLTNMNKLLQTINPQSGEPDHCINIAKYVTYNLYLPKHSLIAIKILNIVTNSSIFHRQFMDILLIDENTRETIRNGFVECLDSFNDEDSIENTKMEILKLLKQCLPYHAPNLTHFLCGFDVRDVTKTEFQFPGILNFPRTCIHSVISIMDGAVTRLSEPSATLLESTYHFLYCLISDGKTAQSVLRFLRLNKNFFKDHLMEAQKNIKENFVKKSQLSWLLKILAVELSVVSKIKHVTYLKQLTSFLVNVPVESSRNQDMFSLVQKTHLETRFIMLDDIKMENFMTNLIPYFEYNEPPLETPSFELFNKEALHQILQTCQRKTIPKLIDVKKVHQILYDELKTLTGTSLMGQMHVFNEEIPKVLKYAVQINQRTENVNKTVQFVNGWRQVVEVLVTLIPVDILSSTEQQIVSIVLLKRLLEKILKAKLVPESSRLLAGCVLLMIDNLKQCHLREKRLQKISSTENDVGINIVKLYSTTLKEILETLISWIVSSDVVDGELRMNLYASLVTFLQLANLEASNDDLKVNDSSFITRLDNTVINSQLQLPFSLDIFWTFREKLIEVLCHDFTGGQEICKILAMSSFGHLLTLSGNVQWQLYMSSKGYSKNIIQSLALCEEELKNILEPNTPTIKPLYLYMAKMLLLAQLAKSDFGSKLLLDEGLMSILSNLSIFTYHPDVSKTWELDRALEDFLPTVEQRYMQIWLPTLHIANAILTNLGAENESAVHQIMCFLLSHLDVVENVLRSGSAQISEISLKELALLTTTISGCARHDLAKVLEDPNGRAHIYRIQKLMLSLLPKFILYEKTVSDLVRHPSSFNSENITSERLLHAMQVIANVLNYSRKIMFVKGNEQKLNMLFYPTLTSSVVKTFSNERSSLNVTEQEPYLGVVVEHLVTAVKYHNKEKETCQMLTGKLCSIPMMNSAELTSFVDDSLNITDLLVKKEKAYEILSLKLEKKKKELRYIHYIIENSLYIIWGHLDFYMLKAIPKMSHLDLIHSTTFLNPDMTLASASEATWRVSTDTISKLKKGLVSTFNDTFRQKLLETTKDQPESDQIFVQSNLRSIQQLLQFVPVE